MKDKQEMIVKKIGYATSPANGSILKVSNSSSIGLPNSASMISRAFAPEKAGTLSCRSFNCSRYSFGTMSIRVEKICPS